MRAPSLVLALSFSVPLVVSAQESPASPDFGGVSKRMQGFIDQGQIAGAVTLEIAGDKAYIQTAGLADLATGRPMREDTIFAIASMTKPIVATALLQLQDAGKLSVDDPVSKHLPDFAGVQVKDGETLRPPKRPVTIRDVMTHTAGLAQPPRRSPSDGDSKPGLSLAEATAYIAKQPLAFEPGSKWQYSSGLTVCGSIIEAVSGREFSAYLDEEVLKPLKMVDTTFHPTAAQRERLATLYKPKDGAPEGKMDLEASAHIFLSQSPETRLPPHPGGGLFSTAEDLARFYRMILNGGELDGARIVSAEAIRQMSSVRSGDVVTGFTPGNGWGLGWCVVREPQGVSAMLSPGSFGHGGAWGTQGWIDPVRKAAFVLLIQRLGLPNSDGSDMRAAFQEEAVKALSSQTGAR